MQMETVVEIMGGGEDSGEGRNTRKEMVINRISEGGMMPNMNSAVSTVMFVGVNIVFNVVMIGLSSK
jgi:hypothetical protein